MTAQTIWYEVFDLHQPAPEPFAVIKIDTSIRKESGVEGTVVSLHWDRGHATDVARALTERELQGISSQ
jgi:hypothetical protein